MPTHAEITGKLLTDAAEFFRKLAEQNEPIKQQMEENAGVFEQMAELITNDPHGTINDEEHKHLAGKLLKDAAEFFRRLAEQNEPIQEQMEENANVYDQIADLIVQDPDGILE